MNPAIPVNVRIVATPGGETFPLELLYTGTREGLDVWKATSDVHLPPGTTKFHLAADVMPPKAKIDVNVGWEGQQ